MAHTPASWRMATDAQGPCMVMHPTRAGVAIASLTSTFNPANGLHEDWECWLENGRLDEAATDARIAERNANARLIAAAPDLLAALQAIVDENVDYMTINHLGDPEQQHNIKLARAAIAKATGS